MKNRIRILAGILGLAVLSAAAAAAAAASATAALQVEASLDRQEMTTDDTAILTLTVSGDRRVEVELSPVEGLRFQARGSSSRMQMINGQVSSSISRTVLVTASKPGDYVIPPVRAKTGGDEVLSAAPLQLKVTMGTGRGAPGMPQSRGAAPAPNFSPGGQAESAPNTVTAGKPGDLAFLEVIPGKTETVVGELIPIEIRAFFRAGERISLRSLPKVRGGSFTLKNQEGDARQERVSVNGMPYTRLTFYAGIAAAKPGEFPAEMALDATVVVREEGSGRGNPMKGLRSRMGTLFDDPFFGGDDLFDDFFGRLVEKEVDLAADPIAMTVTELPAEGRPPGFRGAVGKFTVRAVAAKTAVRTGDPVTLKVAVEGEGNFDRVSMPKLTDSANWKVYPASSEFVSGDAIGQSGVKLFEQVIVPLSPEITEVPALEFAYYDPEPGSYQVARTAPVLLEVTGEAVANAEAFDEARSAAGAVEEESAAVDAGRSFAAITPLYARPWFLATQALAAMVILSGLFAMLFRNWRSNPERVLRKEYSREVGRACTEMDRAITRNDPGAFFDSIRRILQWHAGRTLGLEPVAVTASEVSDEAIREILSTAEAVAFSGQSIPVTELASWKEKVLQLVNS